MKKTPLQEKFDHRIWIKAQIGIPFTLEDVAQTLEIPSTDLRSSWMAPHVNSGLVRIVGTERSKNPKNRGRQVNVYSGTYYLDLEEAERKEAEGQALADHYREAMEKPVILSATDSEKIRELLAG